MSIFVIAVSSYLVLARKEISDFIFLLAMVCFTSGGLGMGFGLGVPFIAFSYTFAYVLMGLVFMASKESTTGGIASFFSLRKEFEKTQKELEISQHQLEKSEDKFKSLVDLIAEPVVIVDRKGHFLEVNDKVVELTGFSKEELVGKNFFKTDIVPMKSKAILVKNLAKRMMGMNVKPYEIEVNRKNGEPLYAEVLAKKIEFEDKSADLVVFHDITERKLAEQKMEESEKKFRHLFESSPFMIVLMNMEGKIVDINNKVIDFTGYNKKDLINKDFRALNKIIPLTYETISIKKFKEVLNRGYIDPLELQWRTPTLLE